eukprot:1156351-Pelagomonas_calceolata.AAC.10
MERGGDHRLACVTTRSLNALLATRCSVVCTLYTEVRIREIGCRDAAAAAAAAADGAAPEVTCKADQGFSSGMEIMLATNMRFL